MKKPKKITIKHYLNKRLKPKIVNNEPYYCVYVLIIVNRSSTHKPSIIEKWFKDIEMMQKKASTEIKKEKQLIEKQIIDELKKDINFSFKTSRKTIIQKKRMLIRTLQNQLKKHQKELLELEQYNLFATN